MLYTSKPTPEDLTEARLNFEAFKKMIPLMKQSGITLLAGTDLSLVRLPGFSLHDELELLVQSGLSPQEALQTATINPAIVLRKNNSYGTIEAGKVASLVLLNENPLIDIKNTREINAVIIKGRLFDRMTLDKLLMEVQQIAKFN